MRLLAIVLCALTSALFAEEPQSETFKEGNFVVSWVKPWERHEMKSPAIQFAIHRNPDALILVRSYESTHSLESLVDEFTSEYSGLTSKYKEVSRAETAVAGERALMFTFNPSNGIPGMVTQTTLFTHQGIAYRLVGVCAENDINFIADYQEFMERFQFKEPRKEWLQKFEGTPAQTVMLGGLLTFELNRPRWTEKLAEKNANFIECSSFQFVSGGAWVAVRVRMARGDDAFERDEVQNTIVSWFTDARVERKTTKTPKGDVPSFVVTGSQKNLARYIRGTAFVEDGVAVHVWLETLKSQTVVAEPDWIQLISSMRLQKASNPDAPPAYHWMQYKSAKNDAMPLPALARIIEKGAQVFPEDRHDVLSISPDGKRALALKNQNCCIEDLLTHKVEEFPKSVSRPGCACWSSDGGRLLCADGARLSIITLAPFKVETIKETSTQVAFGAAPDEILVCKPVVETPRNSRSAPASTYNASRLQVVKMNGERKTLLEFPLSKFSEPCVSPDGKWIALVSNRDCPRSCWLPGHLYVCAADGSNMRQLTHDLEYIGTIAWAADGKSIFILRSPAHLVGTNYVNQMIDDVYSVDVATGKMQNVTRSGKIHTFWIAGKELFFNINAWDVASSQKGIFRISLDAIPQSAPAAAADAMPPDAAQTILAALRPVVEVKKNRKSEMNQDFIRRCAEAFAQGAAKVRNEAFDFKAPSLESLRGLIEELNAEGEDNRLLILGAGSYYGETLHRCTGAEWDIEPVPFDTWLPGSYGESNSLVRCILPFTDMYHQHLQSEEGSMLDSRQIERLQQGQKLILVYPPSHMKKALDDASGENYRAAMTKIDSGDVSGALDLLTKELQRVPKNRLLVDEVISLCRAAGMADTAGKLMQRAVENGNEVPYLLIGYADEIAKTDPIKALEYYKKATSDRWPPAAAFIKMGKIYSVLSKPALADACWRRALINATRDERPEILKLLKFPPEANNAAVDDDDDP